MGRPKAYNPEQGYKYQILSRNPRYIGLEWEHCDYAVGEQDRDFLLSEYRLAYGLGWEFKSLLLPKKYWKKGDSDD